MSVRMVDEHSLFRKGYLRDVIEQQKELILKAVRKVSRKTIMRADLDTLTDEIQEQYDLRAPVIDEDRISVSKPGDATVEVNGDEVRSVFQQSRFIDGTRLIFFVPFEGEPQLFYCQPSRYSSVSPSASRIEKNHIEFEYKWAGTSADASDADEKFRGDLGRVQKTLQNVQAQVEAAFGSIRKTIRSELQQRRQNVEQDESDVDALPYPITRREDAPATHKVPVERKSIDPAPEENGEGDDPKSRYLGDDDYESILDVLRNMTDVMERSPSAFRDMDEEDLRTHFLVQLNGQFEGPATGETFNRKGKTDIFLPVEGRAVFIAECKFWRGAEAFGEALDQLLGYASWRDTKTALLIFNQNKDTTRVLGQIPGIVEGHSNHIRTEEYDGDSEFRFVLHHTDDAQRPLTMTVMVFDVPT